MAILSVALLQALNVGFRGDFQRGIGATPTQWEQIATKVPSTTKSNTFGWLGQFPRLREWIGDRVLKDMKAHGYSIENKSFESTVSVPRTDIEDDQVGVYSPLMEEMGRAAKTHPDELIFLLLAAGVSTTCYDGQYFFDTDHPVYPNVDGTGTAESVSNLDVPETGAGPAWYLLDTTRAIKPLIFQERKAPVFTPMTKLDDEAVFTSNMFRWGVDSRGNVGFGFWQMAYCSKQTLDGTHYGNARAAMMSVKADGGRPLGITPNLLVVPPQLEGKARKLLEKDAEGGNEWYGTAKVLVCPWLA